MLICSYALSGVVYNVCRSLNVLCIKSTEYFITASLEIRDNSPTVFLLDEERSHNMRDHSIPYMPQGFVSL